MASAGVETEIKLPLTSVEDGRARIQRAGFQLKTQRLLESNTLYDTADLSLRAKGTLLRIREVGDRWVLTFKGAPDTEIKYKTRPEIELDVSDGLPLARIFLSLGYIAVFQYQKYRTEYYREGEPGILTLDETPIGSFLELEGPTHWIDRAALLLGFSESSYITESYGRLYAIYCQRNNLPAANMVFGQAYS
jgi:adenylate cyclase, class 2